MTIPVLIGAVTSGESYSVSNECRSCLLVSVSFHSVSVTFVETGCVI